MVLDCLCMVPFGSRAELVNWINCLFQNPVKVTKSGRFSSTSRNYNNLKKDTNPKKKNSLMNSQIYKIFISFFLSFFLSNYINWRKHSKLFFYIRILEIAFILFNINTLKGKLLVNKFYLLLQKLYTRVYLINTYAIVLFSSIT